MNICICGGGNLGHVVTGYIAAKATDEVTLLTRQPERWNPTQHIITPEGKTLEGAIHQISDSPAALIPKADIVLLCLPGYGIHQTLLDIRPYLKPDTSVGSVVSSTGFFFEALDLLPETTPLFGFQRVPFIARVEEYGKSAHLLGYKSSLSVAIENRKSSLDREDLGGSLAKLFDTPVHLLANYYEASLTNSNPLLHTSRLYSMWHEWHEGIVYPSQNQFYSDWTDEASQLLIDMDEEFFRLLSVLPVTTGAIPTVLDYYESTDASSLTKKLHSIEAFKGILSPMKKVGNGFVPDFQSRYFTEDFPYGLAIVHRLLHEHHIPSPYIDKVYAWGTSTLNSKL